MFASGNQIFFFIPDIHRRNSYFLLALLGAFGDGNISVDFTENSDFLRLSNLEQLGHSGESPRDVLGLGGRPRQLGNDMPGDDIIPLFHHQNGIDRQNIPCEAAATRQLRRFAVLIFNGYPGAIIRKFRFDNRAARFSGNRVNLLLKGPS